MRSIINDNLNEEYYPGYLYKLKMMFSFFISFIIITMVIACVFGIFLLKK